MAIVQLNPSTNSLSDTITALNKAYKTQADITLTNFDDTGVPQVQAGSIFANNGTLFQNTSNATINDSGVANGWVYVKYDVSNARFEYTVTAPVWDDDKQGYFEAGETDRYFFKMYKVGAADFRYKLKFIITYHETDVFMNMLYRNYAAETENNIYDDLTFLVPNVDDAMLIQGYLASSHEPLAIMYKSDADTITIIDGGGAAALAIDDGAGTATTFFMFIKVFGI